MILAKFYTDILNRLQETLPGLKHIDLWNFQIDQVDEKGNLPFLLPAAFIQFSPVAWKSTGRYVQRGDIIFSIIVVTECSTEVSSRESENVRNLGLEHLQMIDNIYIALTGWSGDYFEACRRAENIFDHEFTNVFSNTINFTTQLLDDSASPKRVRLIDAGQVIIPDIEPNNE